MSVLTNILTHFNHRMVITKEDAAFYLGYKAETIQKILEKKDTDLNKIFYKAGKSWRCDVRDLAEFIESDKHKHLDASPLNTSGVARKRFPKNHQNLNDIEMKGFA